MKLSPSIQLLLLAHGSRQSAWARPFEAVKALLEQRHPEWSVRLAYLETMQPSLHQALEEAGQLGIAQVHIAPLFLGAGGHLQRDIPQVAMAVQARYPKLSIGIADAAGKDAGVIAALADFAARSMPPPQA